MALSPDPGNTQRDYYIASMVAAASVVILFLLFVCCPPARLFLSLRCRFYGVSGGLDIEAGRNPRMIIPTYKYSREQPESSDTADCSVCLSAFVDGEDVRRMPGCKHMFHAPCIDMWLHSHSDCPLCRATVLPPVAVAGDSGESRRHLLMESSMLNVGVAIM